MFEKFKLNSAANRLIDEKVYEQVVNELSQGVKKSGLWAKALANSEGVEEKAKALYIKYRVQAIKDEVKVPLSNLPVFILIFEILRMILQT